MIACDESMKRISEVLKRQKKQELQLDYPNFLVELEVRYEKAMIDRAKGQPDKSISNLTAGLVKDKKFELGQRKRYIRAIIDTMVMQNQELTPGILHLKQRYLQKISNFEFLLALDYSQSMRQRGKIDNSVKALLNIWDNYLSAEDLVAFARFNLNVEMVFDFESKYVNEFSKRNQIESSCQPKDRTSLMDSIIRLVKKFKLGRKSSVRKLMILVTEGDDSSSIQDLGKVGRKLVKSGITLICVGLNSNPEQAKTLERIARMSMNGVFIDVMQNLDGLVQMMTDFKRNDSYSMIKYEHD